MQKPDFLNSPVGKLLSRVIDKIVTKLVSEAKDNESNLRKVSELLRHLVRSRLRCAGG
jgi:hypothetical protein